MRNIIFVFLFFLFATISGAIIGASVGYSAGYENGEWDGKYNNFDEIWKSGYADGYVWGYRDAIIWFPELSHDAYVYYYNNSVWNCTNGTSAEDSFKELTTKYLERRK